MRLSQLLVSFAFAFVVGCVGDVAAPPFPSNTDEILDVPQLVVPTLTMPNQDVGTVSAPQYFTVTNSHPRKSVTLRSASTAPPFFVEGFAGPLTLGPGQTTTIAVTFRPTAIGTFTGQLVCVLGRGTDQIFPLEGTAVAPTDATDPGDGSLTCPTTAADGAFVGCYYGAPDFSDLRLVRTSPAIDFDWGLSAPDQALDADGFSVRWSGRFAFDDDTYRFTAGTDDGMRVSVDGGTIIDAWYDQAPTTYTADVPLSAGIHEVVVEYYENAGGAVARLAWAKTDVVVSANCGNGVVEAGEACDGGVCCAADCSFTQAGVAADGCSNGTCQAGVCVPQDTGGGPFASRQGLLAYLNQLPQRSDHRVISGLQFGCAGCGGDPIVKNQTINEQTGHYVGLMAVEYTNFAGSVIPSLLNPGLIDHWNHGGLVSASAHFYNPWSGGNYYDHNMGNFEELYTPGTVANTNWVAVLDQLAAGFKELQDAGVIVLFRPLHEMNYGWWWWGYQYPASYKQAWIYLHDYLTITKGLHNLLWVFSPNYVYSTNAGQADVAPMTYYPGDAYVDVVGLDVYVPEQSVDASWVHGYDELIALGKPFAFTEFGSDLPDFEFHHLIEGIQRDFPRTVYFNAWGWGQAPLNPNVKALLDDPWIINRGGLQ